MKNEKPAHASAMSPLIRKSRTLYQHAIKNPATHGVMLARKAGHNMDIARSKSIAHFAPRPIAINTSQKPASGGRKLDIGPSRHPLAMRVDRMRSIAQQPATKVEPTKSLKTVKEEAIAEALQAPAKKQPPKSGFLKRHFKFINIFSISLAVFIVIGCIIYLNMPSISVRVASYQAGIGATFPKYHPDGYSLDGPVSYANDEVTINFRANTGTAKFTIKQTKSSWDSSAVKNKVNKDSKGEFITTQERGLTIYTYNGNAAWVNGGILYTITGNAPLSGDQIRRIATSL